MLNDDFFAIEYNATRDRYIKRQERMQRQEGFGSTDGGIAIVNKFLDQLVSTFGHHIDLARNSNSSAAGLLPNLLQLDRHLLALCALQTALHCVGDGTPFGVTVSSLGQALEAECFRAGLTKADRKIAAEVKRSLDESGARRTAAKRAKARAVAARLGFKVPVWEKNEINAAGGWMMDWLLSTARSRRS